MVETIDERKRDIGQDKKKVLENKLISPSLDLIDQLLDIFYEKGATILKLIRRVSSCKDQFTKAIKEFHKLYEECQRFALRSEKEERP